MILANVRCRPTRTIVTVFAVALEVAMLLLVIGLTTGELKAGGKQTEGVGADIMVQPAGASWFLGITSAPMPAKDARVIQSLPEVKAVAPVLVQFNTSGFLGVVYGIDMRSFDAVSGGFVYKAGGPLKTPRDALVDDWFASSQHAKVGSEISILGHRFQIAGIVAHGKGARVFIPLLTVQRLKGAPNGASVFYVKCAEPKYTASVIAAIRKALPNRKVLSVREYLSMLISTGVPGLKDFVGVMVVIAVGIGFLIVLLSMYSTITERTREIGILKSLGASKTYVVTVVLLEAGVLVIAGIGVGYLLAEGAKALVITFFPTIAIQPQPTWYLWAAILALGGGLMGTTYPALRAATLDPVDALSYE
ncbi:MAG TPA: ABC transporter permease [Terriglobia bacterium]|nr:ABC transporter permease [Terriglobia bacterium]